MQGSDEVVLPPGPRNWVDDFVAKGLRMDPDHIEDAKKQWRRFLTRANRDAPVDTFHGRGIAILSGSLPYLVPSLVALKSLRRSGCNLPIELWFPETEMPAIDIARGIERLGARVQTFPLPDVLGTVRA
jgi:alpha 1,2-mannosyltransferase